MKVAVVQMDVQVGQVKNNFEKALQMVEEAGRQGADIAVLPELWSSGYTWLENDRKNRRAEKEFLEEMVATQRRIGLIEAFRERAEKGGFAVVLGSIPTVRNGRVYNTSLLIDETGREVGRYSKIHLFKLMEEHQFLAPGESLPVYELGGVSCGVQICYDLRFPEAARTLALRGSRMLIYPSQWPDPRREHFEALLLSRAIENQCFVVAVNRVGESGGTTFFGRSTIIGPWGELVLKVGAQEGVWCADVDIKAVTEARKTIPCFDDRRPRLYGIENDAARPQRGMSL